MGRTFTYDAIGRMNGSSGTVGANFPYAYNPTYNEFGNVTSSSYLYWQSGSTNVTFNATYQNNRVLTASDAGQSQTWNYDAMGNRTSLVQNGTTIENISINVLGLAVNSPIDGEGQPIKLVSDFYVRSTVLGGSIITQLDYAGVKSKTRVHDGGSLLAEQVVTGTGNEVQWHHRDPLNVVARDTKAGQVKRKTFAINPVGAQIESTEGVNIGQYYACLYGGQNNPGCTGYTPQPPGNYGPAANAANGQFAASIKVDGALTLRSLGDILAQAQRAGIAVDLWISPALSGTPITQGIDGGVIRRSVSGWKEVAGHVTKNGKYERDFVETVLDAWQFVPGGNTELNQSSKNQQASRAQKQEEAKDKPVTDSAGRLCLEEKRADIEIRNRHIKFAGGPVPHTWIKTPNREVGFGPIPGGLEGPGFVQDNSDRRKYRIDYALTFTACPDTLNLINAAIDANSRGHYVYSNRPKSFTRTENRHVGGEYWEETKFYPAGYNCVGWAMMVLERAGIKPPVASSTPDIYPLSPK